MSAHSTRNEVDLALRQVTAIDAFNRARAASELALAASTRTREIRLDSARRLDALRQQHEALIARAHEQLAASGQQLREHAERRVVIAHRSGWFVDRAVRAFADSGVRTVATTDNGAHAIGICVAEQPDLVLLEEGLLMVPGLEVLRQARLYVPDVVAAAQTAGSDGVGRLLDAGATAVFTRQIPPAQVVSDLLGLVPA